VKQKGFGVTADSLKIGRLAEVGTLSSEPKEEAKDREPRGSENFSGDEEPKGVQTARSQGRDRLRS